MIHEYRFGIEEEFFLADATSRGTPRRTVGAFHAAVKRQLPVERELLQAQVEIASNPSTRFAEARETLGSLRARLGEIGREHGILVLASGTHPTARWRQQRRTDKPRYARIAEEMQILGRRDVVCGMHVHVEVPSPDDRVDLMNRLMPFTPLFMALSASSPFWQGRDTGLAGYRLAVWGEMPRTGLPDLFVDAADYQRFVATMERSGAIADASYLWWTLRPSARYPTLELRVCDSCTRLDDVLGIAALYRCLVRLAVRRPDLNARVTGASRAIAAENLWRAQRYGAEASFIDEARGDALPLADYTRSVLAMVAEDAEALGCAPELDHVRAILNEGTSADLQRAIFAQGATPSGALAAVVDWIATTTVGVSPEPAEGAALGRLGTAWDRSRFQHTTRNGDTPMAKASKTHIGAGSQGKHSGTGAMTDLPQDEVGDNMILSNRDKSRHGDQRGLDSKAIQSEQRQDNPASHTPPEDSDSDG